MDGRTSPDVPGKRAPWAASRPVPAPPEPSSRAGALHGSVRLMSAARGRGLRAMGAMMLAGGVAIAAAEMRMRACVPAGDVVEDDLVGRNGFIKEREGVPPGSAAPKACR